MNLTLNKIREHSPCQEGWEKLLRSKGKTKSDDEEFSMLDVLESNGFDDALWCLRCVSGYDREIRLFAVWCARQVEHLNPDHRVKKCNDVAEQFANGLATKEQLVAARVASWDAASDATWDAASDAARAAASDAAWDAARAAARAAASAAAWDAAMDAARASASAAARAAARYAASAAASAAARYAQKQKFFEIVKEAENEQNN